MTSEPKNEGKKIYFKIFLKKFKSAFQLSMTSHYPFWKKCRLFINFQYENAHNMAVFSELMQFS